MKNFLKKIDTDGMPDALFCVLFDAGLILALLGLYLAAWNLFWLGIAMSIGMTIVITGVVAITVGISEASDWGLLCGLASGALVMVAFTVSMVCFAVAWPVTSLLDKIAELPFGKKLTA